MGKMVLTSLAQKIRHFDENLLLFFFAASRTKYVVFRGWSARTKYVVLEKRANAQPNSEMRFFYK